MADIRKKLADSELEDVTGGLANANLASASAALASASASLASAPAIVGVASAAMDRTASLNAAANVGSVTETETAIKR